jgi:hypothetical protein
MFLFFRNRWFKRTMLGFALLLLGFLFSIYLGICKPSEESLDGSRIFKRRYGSLEHPHIVPRGWDFWSP